MITKNCNAYSIQIPSVGEPLEDAIITQTVALNYKMSSQYVKETTLTVLHVGTSIQSWAAIVMASLSCCVKDIAVMQKRARDNFLEQCTNYNRATPGP